MPTLLLSPALWKIAGAVGLAAALLLGVHLLLVHERELGRAQIKAQWDAANVKQQQSLAAVQTSLQGVSQAIDGHLQAGVAGATSAGQAINVNIQRETANAPRYSNPDCSLTDGMRAQINAARQLSAPAADDQGTSGAMPPSAAANGAYTG